MELGTVVRILIVILLIVVPLISQIAAKIREANKVPPGGGVRLPQRPRQEDFKQEIEDFLRRAAEGRQPKRPAQGRPPQPRPARRPTAPPAKATPEETPPSAGSVVEHVKKHLDASDFSRRSRQLGEEVAQSDDKADARAHQVFEHRLGQFDAGRPSEDDLADTQATTVESSAAAGIAMMLANPESVRQAIVLNEILQRPEHRWA